jgi:hypothetical protein
MEEEGMNEQSGFKAKRGTNDGLFTISIGLWKRKEHTWETCKLFIDLVKRETRVHLKTGDRGSRLIEASRVPRPFLHERSFEGVRRKDHFCYRTRGDERRSISRYRGQLRRQRCSLR